MSLILISSHRFAEHQTPPGHPESPERAGVMERVASRWREAGGEVVAPREASHEQIARVHDADYLKRFAETAGRAVALDPDTYTSPETYEIALLAAGAAIDAVERVMGSTEQSRGASAPGRRAAFALVRPPGHHAERARAMGFCLINNVAVAAAHTRALGVDRVAIVDVDVHHGNGTQHLFDRDPHVLYVSLHQYPFYPGTGAAAEVGKDAGEGFTVNAPLEGGATDEDYRVVFAEVVGPVLQQFKPSVLLVSAGYDAHERDPLGGMRLTTPGFAAMMGELCAAADQLCEGRLALVTEGGYDLEAFGACLQATVEVLSGRSAHPAWPAPGSVRSSRGRAAADAAKLALARYWRF